MIAFIDDHREAYGVEPICKVLPIAPSTYHAHIAQRIDASKRSARERRDAELKVEVQRVFAENFGVYGARKVWRQLRREGFTVARCTVERLMHEMGLTGVRRGRRHRTTRADATAARPADLVGRNFNPPAPNHTWVADFTYVPTWSGMVYVAFVLDAYSRRILGWRAATSMKTSLVLDALEQAMWTRTRDGAADLSGLVCHHDAGSQYTSIAYTERLAQAGIDPSVGTVGDAYDNALAESVIGLFKTELIKPGGAWRTVEQVEIASLEWVDWFNHRRLYQACGDIAPAELEAAHYRQQAALTEAGHSTA
jgi:putative transposase